MNRLLFILGLLLSPLIIADTMDHYMNIVNQIPKMEMRADPKAQSWARSARTVLALTNETLAETLMQANEYATTQGKPFFCLPKGIALNEATLSTLITHTYAKISSQKSDKDKMTVSQLAWLGVTTQYPCNGVKNNTVLSSAQPASTTIQHLDSILQN